MLTQCPECELQVSDKAITCPHCGYPLKSPARASKTRKYNKRRRLPNGFGQITEIKNRNLRKPFRAMVTVGKNESGRPICKLLKPESYFETYNEAYAALVEYHKNPYDLDPGITVKELYDRWSTDYFGKLKSKSSSRTITAAWKYCSSVYNMRAGDIRARHIKGCIDSAESPNTKSRIKSLFNLMLDYAVEYELVDRNYARTFKVSESILEETNAKRKEHKPFTDDEMEKLWNNLDMPYVSAILIQCYSGWRPQELGLIKLSDVDLENWTFRGGMKTEAGTYRLVPIHKKIRGLVKSERDKALRLNSEYLLNCTEVTSTRSDKFMSYDKYQKRFIKVRDAIGLDKGHRPHDGRVHFVTTAKRYGVDDYAIKYMVGHSITDITEKIYTKRDIEWLISEIDKIK